MERYIRKNTLIPKKFYFEISLTVFDQNELITLNFALSLKDKVILGKIDHVF